jgi:hypothetical protein
MKSLLAENKRLDELEKLRALTPEQRLKALVRLNARIKRLFFSGLSSRGFSQEEIVRLWRLR